MHCVSQASQKAFIINLVFFLLLYDAKLTVIVVRAQEYILSHLSQAGQKQFKRQLQADVNCILLNLRYSTEEKIHAFTPRHYSKGK